VDDLGSLDLGFEPEHARFALAAVKRAVAEFGDGLEGDQGWAIGDHRRVAVGRGAPGTRSALNTSASMKMACAAEDGSRVNGR
jgi:hypothetical protein